MRISRNISRWPARPPFIGCLTKSLQRFRYKLLCLRDNKRHLLNYSDNIPGKNLWSKALLSLTSAQDGFNLGWINYLLPLTRSLSLAKLEGS